MMPARGPHGYSRVLVTMFSWAEETEGFEEEILALEHVFRRIYNYETSAYKIPLLTSDYACSRNLGEYLHDIASSMGENDLLIVYYAGHATHNFDKTFMILASRRPCIPR